MSSGTTSKLPSLRFDEPDKESQEDQRPFVRYLRFLHRTDPAREMKTIQITLSGRDELPTAEAYLEPTRWMCELKQDDIFGNHLVADQDISANSPIGFEHPILYVSDGTFRCADCDRKLPSDFVRCNNKHDHDGAASCPLRFCSENCRDWAWEHYHKVQDAKLLGALYEKNRGSPYLIDTLFAVKGLSMMQLPEPNQHALSYIESFVQNPHLLKKADDYTVAAGPGIELLKAAAGHIYKENAEEETKLEKLVTTLIALRHIYAFGGDGGCSYLFGPSCLINHSCVPNVSVGVMSGHDSPDLKGIRPYGTITALRPIRKGEQLFFNYRGQSMTPRSTRKANILSQYGFECHCHLCNDGIARCDLEGCQKENVPMKKCGQCKHAVYCSRECQKKDWKHHKKFCNLKSAGLYKL